MGRRPHTDPAVCPHCQQSFEGAGKDRYRNLRRHITSVHTPRDAKGPQTIINNTNIFINSVVYDFSKCSDEILLQLVSDRLKARLDHIMETNDGNTLVPIFSALRCNPEYPETHIASIPNVSKDRMLVMTNDGIVEVHTKREGASKVLDHISSVDIPAVIKVIDDPTLKLALQTDKNFTDEVKSGIISTLESIPRLDRTRTSNRLKQMTS